MNTSDSSTNKDGGETGLSGTAGSAEEMAKRLLSLPRMDVGFINDGGGHMDKTEYIREHGEFVYAEDVNRVIKEFVPGYCITSPGDDATPNDSR